MNKRFIVAVGTRRAPKLAAIRAVLDSIGAHLGGDMELVTRNVASGVRETPVRQSELVSGALNRVKRLRALMNDDGLTADFFVGMEGGFHRLEIDGKETTFLQGWAAVSDGVSVHYGSSPNIEVPDKLVEAVYYSGESLGDAIDAFSGDTDVRSRQGAFGVFTRDLLTRQASFEAALLAAFAPFYNKDIYDR